MQTEKEIINAHRLEAVIGANNSLTLEDLPFNEGKEVEVIVLEKSTVATSTQQANTDDKPTPRFPLRGKTLKYIDPFEPAAPLEDWEVYK